MFVQLQFYSNFTLTYVKSTYISDVHSKRNSSDNELEGFEVKLLEEGDEIENNPYQGCKLIIQDDKKREFVTMTPGLIRMVAQFIFDACHEKLAEIEANIIFPNA